MDTLFMTDEDSHNGPPLLHHRSATIKDVAKRQSTNWEELLKKKIEVPNPKVYLYTPEGNPSGELTYSVHVDNRQHNTGTDQESIDTTEIDHKSQRCSTGESCHGSYKDQYESETSKDDTKEQGELVFGNEELASIQDECEHNEEEQKVQDMNKMSEEPRQTRGINQSIDIEEPTLFKTKHAACIAKILGSIDKVVE